MIVLIIVLILLQFYTLYLAIMSLYRGKRDDTLSWPAKLLGYPILAVGVLLDLLINITIFSVLFIELPRQLLVTSRLKSHIKEDGWRGSLARFICKNLLSPFDPTGDHCD